MNSGMYAALSGSIAAMQRMETLTNSLAYAGNTAYKKDHVMFEAVLASVSPTTTPASELDRTPVQTLVRVETDYSAGLLGQSGNTLDFALDGDGFFVVNTPQGKAYTRQGNFHRDITGKLLTFQGYEVLGNKGRPIILANENVQVGERGEISVDGLPQGSLDVVDFPKPYALQRAGGSLFTADPELTPQPVTTTLVRQNFLEKSNVNSIMQMAQVLAATRDYESNLKAVRSYDEMVGKAANELGKL